MEALVRFANAEDEGDSQFIHPVIRGIVLHFWLAFDHPFEDGNGRVARALFYWVMLHQGYWLFEFISLSSVIKEAPAQYARAFLETETDDNDLTYFILNQLESIERAVAHLETYLERKAQQVQRVEELLHNRADLNDRQLALLSHAIRHPGHRYTTQSHRRSHAVAYATARSDLLGLAELELLDKRRAGKGYSFRAPPDLEDRIRGLS
jgi:Fic family protein